MSETTKEKRKAGGNPTPAKRPCLSGRNTPTYSINIPKNLILPSVHLLCLQGELNKLLEELEAHPEQRDTKDPLGNTLLHIASGIGQEQTVRYLIEKNVNINLKNLNGLTALHLVVRHNQYTIFNILTMCPQLDYTTNNVDGISILHLAAKYGRDEMLNFLLSKIFPVTETSNLENLNNWKDSFGQNPLHYAALQNHSSVCAILLAFERERFKSNRFFMDKDLCGMTPLLAAVASTNSVEVIKNIFFKDDLIDYFQPFYWDTNCDGKSIIHLATEKGNLTTLNIILEKLKVLNSERFQSLLNNQDKHGITPLLLAKSLKFVEIENILLNYGATVCYESLHSDSRNLNCGICMEIYWKAVRNYCGHTFCRSCLQQCRKSNNSCPVCRAPIKLVHGNGQGTLEKSKDLHVVIKENLNDEFESRKLECETTNVMEIFIKSLKYLSKNLKKLKSNIVIGLLDKKHSVNIVDGDISYNITYVNPQNAIYIYAKVLFLQNISEDKRIPIFQHILEKSCVGSNLLLGGGVGIVSDKKVLVFHVRLATENLRSDESFNFSNLFEKFIRFSEMIQIWKHKIDLYVKNNTPFLWSGEEMARCKEQNDGSQSITLTQQRNLGLIQSYKSSPVPNNSGDMKVTIDNELTICEVNNNQVFIRWNTVSNRFDIYSILLDDVPHKEPADMHAYLFVLLCGSVFSSKTPKGGFSTAFVDHLGHKSTKLLLQANLELTRFDNSNTELETFVRTFVEHVASWKRVFDTWSS